MGSIKVATLNLQNRQNRWLDRRELIVAELLETQPDLLSLQEVYRPIGQARSPLGSEPFAGWETHWAECRRNVVIKPLLGVAF